MLRSIAKTGIAVVILSVMSFWLASSGLCGDPDGKYSNVDPETKAWVKGLKSPFTGDSACCDIADGNPPEAVWKVIEKYHVRIGGEWYEVPDAAVITEPNKLGRAIVWYYYGSGLKGSNIIIKCFIPGTMM